MMMQTYGEEQNNKPCRPRAIRGVSYSMSRWLRALQVFDQTAGMLPSFNEEASVIESRLLCYQTSYGAGPSDNIANPMSPRLEKHATSSFNL
jgi:hypothetical protein